MVRPRLVPRNVRTRKRLLSAARGEARKQKILQAVEKEVQAVESKIHGMPNLTTSLTRCNVANRLVKERREEIARLEAEGGRSPESCKRLKRLRLEEDALEQVQADARKRIEVEDTRRKRQERIKGRQKRRYLRPSAFTPWP
jgi:hypothetical protein